MAIPRKKGGGGRNLYWWNEDVAEARRRANDARRDVTKCRKDLRAIEEVLSEAKS